MHFVKEASLSLFSFSSSTSLDAEAQRMIGELQRENQVLLAQLEHLRQWLLCEDRIEQQMQRLKEYEGLSTTSPAKDFYQRRALEMTSLLGLELQALPAKVIFREPATWSSFLWINVGEKHNRALGKKIVAKNSPVLFGGCLVGVIEDVRISQSRVRLITDERLTPSVRSVRGQMQSEQLCTQLQGLVRVLEVRKDLFRSSEEHKAFLSFFDRLKSRLDTDGESRYLAKGILKGNSTPQWRARTTTLSGLGFNYDRSDKEGPAKELRTGRPLHALASGESLALLKEGDLLITSGLDGVLPAGLPVAFVKTVETLKEGSTAYDITAEAAVGSLDHLTSVVVLPAIDFDKK
jgi:cell shape-determining protein MreC